MKEKEIEINIIDKLSDLLPSLKLKRVSTKRQVGKCVFDLSIDIETETGLKKTLLGEIKGALRPILVEAMIPQLKKDASQIKNAYPLLISSFIGERIRAMCQENHIGYLDLAGNCYLKFDKIYIEKIVDKNPFHAPKITSTIFSPVSSRILRVLLEEPKRKWKLYELSEIAPSSLGQTSKTCRKLLQDGYVKKDKGKLLTIEKPTELLDEWRENYSFETNEMLTFYSFERKLSKLMQDINDAAKRGNLAYAFTLHCAALLIAPFVRGIETAWFYIEKRDDLKKWNSNLDLRRVESGGNVFILIPYDKGILYNTQKAQGVTTVSNIQLYLDLYKNPARGKEQAEFLRRQKIKF